MANVMDLFRSRRACRDNEIAGLRRKAAAGADLTEAEVDRLLDSGLKPEELAADARRNAARAADELLAGELGPRREEFQKAQQALAKFREEAGARRKADAAVEFELEKAVAAAQRNVADSQEAERRLDRPKPIFVIRNESGALLQAASEAERRASDLEKERMPSAPQAHMAAAQKIQALRERANDLRRQRDAASARHAQMKAAIVAEHGSSARIFTLEDRSWQASHVVCEWEVSKFKFLRAPGQSETEFADAVAGFRVIVEQLKAEQQRLSGRA